MRESAPELAKFDVSSWFGMFLPKSAPAPVVDALNKQIKAMLERDDIKKTIATMGARADYGTPQQFADFVAGGDREIRRHHQAGRPADGRELISRTDLAFAIPPTKPNAQPTLTRLVVICRPLRSATWLTIKFHSVQAASYQA